MKLFAVLFIPLLATSALAAPPAPPACRVSDLRAELGAYTMPRGAEGTLSFRVSCPPGQRARVVLLAPGGPLTGPQATVWLAGPGAPAVVTVELPDLSVQGERHFTLALRAAPGQRALAGGLHSAPLEVTVQREGR